MVRILLFSLFLCFSTSTYGVAGEVYGGGGPGNVYNYKCSAAFQKRALIRRISANSRSNGLRLYSDSEIKRDMEALNKPQIQSLSPAEVRTVQGYLSREQISWLSKKQLSALSFRKLTDKQVQALTADQIVLLSPVRLLVIFKELSIEQRDFITEKQWHRIRFVAWVRGFLLDQSAPTGLDLY